MLPITGCFLNTLGLIFLGVSHTANGVNLLHPGAILIGLGGITFHLAQVTAAHRDGGIDEERTGI